MEDYAIYIIVAICAIYLYKKIFGKDSSCGCSGNSKGSCSKK